MKTKPNKCLNCGEPVTDDGYGDVVHADGLYTCDLKDPFGKQARK